jgi:hypothetical protein
MTATPVFEESEWSSENGRRIRCGAGTQTTGAEH